MMLQPLVMQGFLGLCTLDCHPEAFPCPVSTQCGSGFKAFSLLRSFCPQFPFNLPGWGILVITPAPPRAPGHKSFPLPVSLHAPPTYSSPLALPLFLDRWRLAHASTLSSATVLRDFCILTFKTLVSHLLELLHANDLHPTLVNCHVLPQCDHRELL